MTRDEFDREILLIEQKTGVTADKEEVEQLWSIWKSQHPFIRKLGLTLSLSEWKNDKEKCEQLQRHYDN